MTKKEQQKLTKAAQAKLEQLQLEELKEKSEEEKFKYLQQYSAELGKNKEKTYRSIRQQKAYQKLYKEIRNLIKESERK